ncbi:hypothetical protein NUSPORA_02487 [Nucleospora cyclopteri]
MYNFFILKLFCIVLIFSKNRKFINNIFTKLLYSIQKCYIKTLKKGCLGLSFNIYCTTIVNIFGVV